MKNTVCIATRNKGKLSEISRILTLPGKIRLVSMHDYPSIPGIKEDRDTYQDNAIKKAETVAQVLNIVTIADDSGLEIDYLHGFPGIRSARHLGNQANDMDRCKYILEQLVGIPREKRTARFVCYAALAIPGGDTVVSRGVVEGFIASQPAGNSGFGYDPIFIVPEYKKRMAELSQEEKNRISHRGIAFRLLRDALLEIF